MSSTAGAKMTDTPPADRAPQPGDTFIVLKGGVPYIGTEPGKPRNKPVNPDGPEGDHDFLAANDVTDELTIAVTAAFDPKELRDPKTGKWVRDPAGKYLDYALKDLGHGKMLSHNGHEVDRSSKGFNVRFYKREGGRKVLTGERRTYEHPQDAAEALRRGGHLPDAELKHGKSHIPGSEPKVQPLEMPKPSGPGLPPDKAKEIANLMAQGKPIGSTAEGRSVRRGAELWQHVGVNADSPQVKGNKDYAAFMSVVDQNENPSKVKLYRGVSGWTGATNERETANLSYAQKVISLKPGESLPTQRAASWTDRPKEGLEFGGVPYGEPQRGIAPRFVGALIQAEPGNVRSLNIKSYGGSHYKGQNEHVTGASADLEVVSNEPHPDIPGMRVITVRDKALAGVNVMHLTGRPPKPGQPSPLEAHFAAEYAENAHYLPGHPKGFNVVDRSAPNTITNLERYRSVPEEARKLLAYEGTEIWFGTRGVTGLDDLQHLKDAQPSGYNKGDTFTKVAAAVSWLGADRSGKRANPYGHTVMAVGGGSSTYGSGSVNVSAHEAGHAIDNVVMFSEPGKVSARPAFTALHQQVMKAFQITPYYVQEANPGQGAREFMAETYAAWAEGRARGTTGDRLATMIMGAVGASPALFKGEAPRGVNEHLAQARAEQVRLGKQLVKFYDAFQKEVQQRQEMLKRQEEMYQ